MKDQFHYETGDRFLCHETMEPYIVDLLLDKMTHVAGNTLYILGREAIGRIDYNDPSSALIFYHNPLYNPLPYVFKGRQPVGFSATGSPYVGNGRWVTLEYLGNPEPTDALNRYYRVGKTVKLLLKFGAHPEYIGTVHKTRRR